MVLTHGIPRGKVGVMALRAPVRLLVSCAVAALAAGPGLADPAPAYLVADINTSVDAGTITTSASEAIVDIGGVAYFVVARSPETGYELWRSDGTQAGTVLVKDIRVGTEPTTYDYYAVDTPPQSLTNVNDTLFFSAVDEPGVFDLWKSDGTVLEPNR
jgi:ELWxxDGT repeat protein